MDEASELFSMVGGVRTDTEIHEAILAASDEVSTFTSTLAVLKRQGYTEDQIAALYGPLYERWKERQHG
jgi:hypothetical protein